MGTSTLLTPTLRQNFIIQLVLRDWPYWRTAGEILRGRWSSSCPWDFWSLPLTGDLDCGDYIESPEGRKGPQKDTRSQLKPTFAAGLGPAPRSVSSTADGGIPNEGVALPTRVLHSRAWEVGVLRVTAVLPVGDAWRRRTLHPCEGEGKEDKKYGQGRKKKN